MKQLLSVVLTKEIDYDPDLSYLGEISDKPKYRHKNEAWIPTRPDNIHNTRWFSPCDHLPHKESNWSHVSDEDKQKVIEKYGSLRKADIAYAYEDLERLLNYNEGRWWMEYYRLTAKIAVSDDGKHWAYDEIDTSLGGIESDGGRDYKNMIIEDLKSELMHDLELWGFERWEIMNSMCAMED